MKIETWDVAQIYSEKIHVEQLAFIEYGVYRMQLIHVVAVIIYYTQIVHIFHSYHIVRYSAE